MPVIRAEEFRDTNLDRTHPFADRVSLSNGVVTIPFSTFVDAALYPPGNTGRMFLSSVKIDTRGNLTLTLADGLRGDVGTCEIATDAYPDVLVFTDEFDRRIGILVPGPEGLTELRAFGVGTYTFDETQTAFTGVVQIPVPAGGVEGIQVDESLISGQVFLVGENGVELYLDRGQLRVDVVGDPLKLFRDCQKLGAASADRLDELLASYPLRTINGIRPDASGNWTFVTGGGLSPLQVFRITPSDQGGLTIEAI